MKLTELQLWIINLVLQVKEDWTAKTYALAELAIASDIFKEIKKCVKDDKFIAGEVKLTSEQKVFLTKAIDERNWSVADADIIFTLKELIK